MDILTHHNNFLRTSYHNERDNIYVKKSYLMS